MATLDLHASIHNSNPIIMHSFMEKPRAETGEKSSTPAFITFREALLLPTEQCSSQFQFVFFCFENRSKPDQPFKKKSQKWPKKQQGAVLKAFINHHRKTPKKGGKKSKWTRLSYLSKSSNPSNRAWVPLPEYFIDFDCNQLGKFDENLKILLRIQRIQTGIYSS